MDSAAKKMVLVSLFLGDVVGVPPLGPLYLATALTKNGFGAKIIHRKAEEIEAVISEIESYRPDLVGMSVFTGYNNIAYAELCRKLKNRGYKIVLGNAHPSLLPEDSLREDYVDFVVMGEGEETLVELMQNFGDESKYSSILGLGWKDGEGRIFINPERNFIANLDDYLIDWSLINVEDYLIPYFFKFKRVFTVTTSRGCPFNCQFCYNQVFNKRRWRAHSPEKVIENLKPLIEKFKIDGIRFFDDNFFVNKERAFKIVNALGLPYFAEARVEFVDEEFVRRLKESKCQEVMFGFESGSDRILSEVVKKGTTTKEIIRAVTLFKDTGMVASGSFVFGFPTETAEEYKETMKFIVKLLEINKNLAFTCGWYLPFPGTGLYDKAKELGFVPPARIEDWEKFNRWRQDYEMEWITWDYKKAVKFTRQIVNLLAMAYKRDISPLKFLLKKRVENLNFSFPFDIYIFSRIRDIYLYSGEKSSANRVIKKIISTIVKFRK